MTAKPVSIVLEGSSEPGRQIEITPGTTVGEALVRVGLDPHETHMTVPGADRLFDPTEDLYRATDPGERLSCSPAMDAGGSAEPLVALIGLTLGLFAILAIAHRAKESSRSHRSRTSPGVDGSWPEDDHGLLDVEEPLGLPDRWLRRNGWTCRGESVEGRFRTGFGTFPARVEWEDGGYQVYFKRPPTWIREGRHSECWMNRGGGWWLLHQNSLQTDIVTVIRSAESFVLEKSAENQRNAS